jgi:hypothetical protein
MNTSVLLRIYRITTAVLIALLAVMSLIFRHNIIFATLATTVVTLVLILIAFQVQRLQLLVRTIAKLDELLDLLRNSKREFSPSETKEVMQQLELIRARLLHDQSIKRPKR